jgi:hypothetical protein
MLIVMLMLMPMRMPMVRFGGREALRAAFEHADAVRIALRHQPMAVARGAAFLRQRPLFGCTPLEV